MLRVSEVWLLELPKAGSLLKGGWEVHRAGLLQSELRGVAPSLVWGYIPNPLPLAREGELSLPGWAAR